MEAKSTPHKLIHDTSPAERQLVEVWSDIACPWCYVGKRRLEEALASYEHAAEVEVVWRSFELDPAAPPEREGGVASHLAKKYRVSCDRAEAMLGRMKGEGAGAGIDFHFESMRLGNTFDAHRVIHLAHAHGLGGEMKERLLAAYFGEGILISDHQTLIGLAEDVGLDAGEAADALAMGLYDDAVRQDERRARSLGITGVPFFLVDGKFAIPGAQTAETMRLSLARARAKKLRELQDGELPLGGPVCSSSGCEG